MMGHKGAFLLEITISVHVGFNHEGKMHQPACMVQVLGVIEWGFSSREGSVLAVVERSDIM
jgi:hypothetical protein